MFVKTLAPSGKCASRCFSRLMYEYLDESTIVAGFPQLAGLSVTSRCVALSAM